MQQTPLQQLRQYVKESADYITDDDCTEDKFARLAYRDVLDKIESLLPVDRDSHEKAWEAGSEAGYSNAHDDINESKRSSPDFTTYWQQFETKTNNDKTEVR